MPRLGISEILDRVQKEPKVEQKIEILRKNDSTVLRHIFKLAFIKNVKWLLPDGKPPFKVNIYPGQQGNLYAEWRRMYLFFPGGNDNLTNFKREMLFIQILETLDPNDAELICNLKDGKLNYKSINRKLVEDAFPDIFNGINRDLIK
jgi:Family of unknown function (DUF6433)